MTEYLKPLPLADEASRPFWDGAMDGKLMLMKCNDCGQFRFPARHHCDSCLSSDYTWTPASGRGSVRTFGVMHQKYQAGWAAETPYNIAIIELEEGPRFPTNLVNIANADIQVGMAVVVDFEKHDVALPKFRPA